MKRDKLLIINELNIVSDIPVKTERFAGAYKLWQQQRLHCLPNLVAGHIGYTRVGFGFGCFEDAVPVAIVAVHFIVDAKGSVNK